MSPLGRPFCRPLAIVRMTQVAKFAPSLGPVPLPPTPRKPKPLDPPLPSPCTPPTPQGILQKTSFFFFLYTLETSKIRCKLRNLFSGGYPPPPHRASFKKKSFFFFLYAVETSKIRRKLYHLPPRNHSPWTPPPEPLYAPPLHRVSFKKIIFLLR